MRLAFNRVIGLTFMSGVVWGMDSLPSFPLVVLEEVRCTTALSEAGVSFYRRLMGIRPPISETMFERAMLYMTIVDEGSTEISKKYVELLVPELDWLAKSYGENTRIGRLAHASLKAFQQRISTISIRQARSFLRAYFGEGFTPRGEVPSSGELALPSYFTGFAPYNIARSLESLGAEAHDSAMLFTQALMTESQLILLGAYGRATSQSRTRNEAYWRLFKRFIAEEY